MSCCRGWKEIIRSCFERMRPFRGVYRAVGPPRKVGNVDKVAYQGAYVLLRFRVKIPMDFYFFPATKVNTLTTELYGLNGIEPYQPDEP